MRGESCPTGPAGSATRSAPGSTGRVRVSLDARSSAGADATSRGTATSSYDVVHYDLDLAYQLESNQLRGRADARRGRPTTRRSCSLDLHRASRHQGAGGRAAAAAKYTAPAAAGSSSARAAASPAGRTFRVAVRYAAAPARCPDGDDEAGWEELDRRGDRRRPAPRRALVVPLQRPAVRQGELPHRGHRAVGVPRRRQRRSGRAAPRREPTTWVYEQPEPMATYLATVQIGRYADAPARRARRCR